MHLLLPAQLPAAAGPGDWYGEEPVEEEAFVEEEQAEEAFAEEEEYETVYQEPEPVVYGEFVCLSSFCWIYHSYLPLSAAPAPIVTLSAAAAGSSLYSCVLCGCVCT